MADRLAQIYGTEQDKVNCPFFHKVGACRHGERCSRLHNRPTFSQTILLSHMYQGPPPKLTESGYQVDPKEEQAHFEDFYEEVFEELSNYGKVEELNVCENLGDHMLGNVYVQFSDEEEAERALMSLNGRFYAGRLIVAEYSPVSDFREARCRQFEENTCSRAGHCNFMHLKRPNKELLRKLGLDRKREDDRARGGGGGGGGGDRRGGSWRGGGGGGGGNGGGGGAAGGGSSGSGGGGGGGGGSSGGRDRYDRERRHDRYDRYDSRHDRYDSRYERGDRYDRYDSRYERGDRYDSRYERDRHDRSRSPARNNDREGSEERRARIAQWNAEREAKDEKRDGSPRQGDNYAQGNSDYANENRAGGGSNSNNANTNGTNNNNSSSSDAAISSSAQPQYPYPDPSSY